MSMKTPAMSMTRTTVNMKDLYLAAFKRADDGKAAQVLVVDELPDGKNILHAKTDFGYEVIGYSRFVPLYPILIMNVKRIPCEDILLFLYIKPYNGLLFRSFTIYNRKTSENLKCGNTIKHFSHI